jgi:hypothetical protein
MPYYRVMLNGTGIRIPGQDGADDIVGFYTTRLVRASSEAEAERQARENVLGEWSVGKYAVSNAGARPTLSTEWIKRTSFFDQFVFKATGHVFYAAEDGAV